MYFINWGSFTVINSLNSKLPHSLFLVLLIDTCWTFSFFSTSLLTSLIFPSLYQSVLRFEFFPQLHLC
jgi:hypothetical protein